MQRNIIILLISIFIISCAPKDYEVVVEEYPNGQIKLKKVYHDEDKTDFFKEIHFYENGNMKMLGFWKDKLKDGKWQYWYHEGTLWSETEFKEGKENGLKTVYYENGNKYYQGEMINGERNGKWTFWDKNGKEMKMLDYPE